MTEQCRFRGRTVATILFFLCTLVFAGCSLPPECPAPTELDAPGGGTKYRFIPENFLDIGNRWEYRVTNEGAGEPEGTDGVPDTVVLEVTGSAEFGGYDTRVVEIASGTELDKVYWYMTSDDLVEAEFEDIVLEPDEDEYDVEQVRCGDPSEMLPIWVYSTDDMRHFGHGLIGWDRGHPRGRWLGSWDTYVTYLGTESITVPAGQFDCVKVEIRNEFNDDDGSYGLDTQLIWSDPGIGLVKIQSDERTWYPDEGAEDTESWTWELIDTNVVP